MRVFTRTAIGHRRSVRLRGPDYTEPGAYFVTLCTRDRRCAFGEVTLDGVQLTPVGETVTEEWSRSADLRAEVELDVFVVMPNHIHGIVVISDISPQSGLRAHGRAPLHRPAPSLGALVAGFKAATTSHVNRLAGTPGAPVWQRNYYEHIIRSDKELERVRQYIAENPGRWAEDPENPSVAQPVGAHGVRPGSRLPNNPPPT